MSRILVIQVTDTLMNYAWDLEVHIESGDRESTYYFKVPDSWAQSSDDRLQERVFAVAQAIYADLNAGFRAAEPNDMGYLRVKATRARVLTEAEEAEMPWLHTKNPAVWEWTSCVVVEEDGSYKKVDRADF